MKINIKAILWVLLYIILIFAPLILMLMVYEDVSYNNIDSETGSTNVYEGETSATSNQDADTSATSNQDADTSSTSNQDADTSATSTNIGIDFLRELSLALGFVGLAMMLLQSLLTSRLRGVHKPFGSDVVYTFHHQISVIALLLVLAHPIILMIKYNSGLELLNIFKVHYSILFGIISLVSVLLLVVISLIRKGINFNYTIWRIIHGFLALVSGGFALVHIFTSGKYTNNILMTWLWIIYAVLWLLLFIYIRLIKPLIMIKNPYKVISVEQNVKNVYNLFIKHKSEKKYV